MCFFSFEVSDRRCGIIVSVPDHCLPFYLALLFVLYSTRRSVLSLALWYFVIVFFSPFSIAITPHGEERANLSAFRTFVRSALVWFCLFSLPLRVLDGLLLVIVALPGLFSFPYCHLCLPSVICRCFIVFTAKHQWLEYLWDHGNLFEIWVVRATEE